MERSVHDLVAVFTLGPGYRGIPAPTSILVRENDREDPKDKLPGGGVEVLDYAAARMLRGKRPEKYARYNLADLARLIAATREVKEETGIVIKGNIDVAPLAYLGEFYKIHRGRCEHFFVAGVNDYGDLAECGFDGEEIIVCATEELLARDILPTHRVFARAWCQAQSGRGAYKKLLTALSFRELFKFPMELSWA